MSLLAQLHLFSHTHVYVPQGIIIIQYYLELLCSTMKLWISQYMPPSEFPILNS